MDACSQSLIRPASSASPLSCSRSAQLPSARATHRGGVTRLAGTSLAVRWRRDQASAAPFSGRRDAHGASHLEPRAVASTARPSSEHTVSSVSSPKRPSPTDVDGEDGRVQQIHSVAEFDAALEKARSRLVVVEYAASHSRNSRNIYPAMVDLSRSCQDVEFLLVMGDESEGTEELCNRAGVSAVPHFIFYKNREKIHEEQGGLNEEILAGDVLYYGEPDSAVQDLHSVPELEALVEENAGDPGRRLLVVDVGLKKCGPCVKVYPTFLKLAKKMSGTAVFARLHGDENDSTMEYMKKMDVVEVPTFLFFRRGQVCGRYVGSGKGDLIGEVLRYEGVRVTY